MSIAPAVSPKKGKTTPGQWIPKEPQAQLGTVQHTSPGPPKVDHHFEYINFRMSLTDSDRDMSAAIATPIRSVV